MWQTRYPPFPLMSFDTPQENRPDIWPRPCKVLGCTNETKRAVYGETWPSKFVYFTALCATCAQKMRVITDWLPSRPQCSSEGCTQLSDFENPRGACGLCYAGASAKTNWTNWLKPVRYVTEAPKDVKQEKARDPP